MVNMSEISEERAQKLLQEVGFEDRLIGVTMGSSTGNSETTLYSLKELAFFLRSDSYEKLSHRGHGSMCYINIDDMLSWIGKIYGDQELADLMAAEMAKVESNADKLEAAAELLRERLKQCNEVLGSNQKK